MHAFSCRFTCICFLARLNQRLKLPLQWGECPQDARFKTYKHLGMLAAASNLPVALASACRGCAAGCYEPTPCLLRHQYPFDQQATADEHQQGCRGPLKQMPRCFVQARRLSTPTSWMLPDAAAGLGEGEAGGPAPARGPLLGGGGGVGRGVGGGVDGLGGPGGTRGGGGGGGG